MGRLMPGFLGIGAMRSGTTWLATKLAQHPRIRMGRKEIHFFNRKIGRLGAPGSILDRRNKVQYLARFVQGPLHGGIRGEVTPAYAILKPTLIQRIHEWMPDVRLIYLMRDPAERTWSHARYEFPTWRGRSIHDVSRDELVEFLASEDVRLRSDYVTCIQNWKTFFPTKQFFFGFLDDIRDQPGIFLRDVFEFIGVESSLPVNEETKHLAIGSSTAAPMPDWFREYVENTWPTDNDQLAELTNKDIPWVR